MFSIETDGFAACFNGLASRQYHSLCPHVVPIMHFATPPQLANVTYKSCEAFADASRRLARFVHSQNHDFLIGKKKNLLVINEADEGSAAADRNTLIYDPRSIYNLFFRVTDRARADTNISGINESRYMAIDWKQHGRDNGIEISKLPLSRPSDVGDENFRANQRETEKPPT